MHEILTNDGGRGGVMGERYANGNVINRPYFNIDMTKELDPITAKEIEACCEMDDILARLNNIEMKEKNKSGFDNGQNDLFTRLNNLDIRDKTLSLVECNPESITKLSESNPESITKLIDGEIKEEPMSLLEDSHDSAKKLSDKKRKDKKNSSLDKSHDLITQLIDKKIKDENKSEHENSKNSAKSN